MKKVVIASACRTPIGRIPGEINFISDTKLLALSFKEVINRCGISDQHIDGAYTGCSFPVERDNLCRKAILEAGLSEKINGATISKTCASSDEAIMNGVYKILCGEAKIILIGGIEKISNSSYALHYLKKNVKNMMKNNLLKFDEISQGIEENDMTFICEMLSRKFDIRREEQDQFAFNSISKALSALKTGKFNDEIFEVEYLSGDNHHKLNMDELLQTEKSKEQIYSAMPVFISDGTLTQFNTSLMCDCAASMILMDYETAIHMNITPLAEIQSTCSIGIDNNDFRGIGMVEAIKCILNKTGLKIDDIDLFELNESFAVQAILCQKALNINPEKINVNGGNLAIGYPIGCTGIRMGITLIYEMLRRKANIGLSTICAGGNMGHATIYKRI